MFLETIARKTLELKNYKIDKIEEAEDGTIRIYLTKCQEATSTRERVLRREVPCSR